MASATTQIRTAASTSSFCVDFSGDLITIQERAPTKYQGSRPREEAAQPNPKGKICNVPRDRAKIPKLPFSYVAPRWRGAIGPCR